MYKKILLLALITTLSTLPLGTEKTTTVFIHGLGSHKNLFHWKYKCFAPKDTEKKLIQFKSRKASFGTKEAKVLIKKLNCCEKTPISIVAHSQGTATALYYLSFIEDCSHVRSIFLHSPLADPNLTFEFLRPFRLSAKATIKIICKLFPRYNPKATTPIEAIDNIKGLSKECPIIITHGLKDTIINWTQGYNLAKKLHELGYSVYFIQHDKGHTNIPCKKVAKIVHAIYKKHGLPAEKSNENADAYSFEYQFCN